MEGGGNRAGGFDSRPTVDMHDIEHESPQLQMEQMFLRVQRKLFGDAYRRTMAHYAVVRPIGQGAMGMVYEAIDQRLSREVALKLVLPEVVQSARGKSRLLREARAMAKISHPNVVAVYDVGETGGVVYIAMEFVRGATLRRWLASAPRSLAEILDVFIQAGAGLAAAHHADIVHRDFKPDNVLVGHDGRARVLDFGLAFPRIAELTSDEVTAPHATAAGFDATRDGAEPPRTNEPTDVSASNMLAGTIAYMSPEQLLARPLDGRSDQFSFCVSLYEGLYGQRPFTGRSFHEFVDHVQRGELAPVANPPRLPGWLTAVLRRGLSTSPDRRHGSMAELIAVLTAGRHALSQRAPSPVWSEARERLLGRLACTLDEQVASSPVAALIRVRRIADQARWLVIAPHDPSAPQLRAAFATYCERLRGSDAPRALRPLQLVGAGPAGDDQADAVALLFEDLACVPLGGLIRQAAGRDPELALRIAQSLTRAVYALAQVGYALDPAALEGLPIGVEHYEIGPIDPTCVGEAGEPAGRYRIVGAALHGLLTGGLPELGAGPAAPDAAPELAAGLRAVIDRLLDPAGYHSARGVLHDLELCVTELTELRGLPQPRPGREPAAFPLGTRDIGGELCVSPVLRGRQRELAELDALARELGGGSGLVLVSGPSGIGKTALIDAMAERLPRGWRIRGKFDQYASSEPYATLTQALRGLVGRALDEPRPAREAWRERIVRAVAPNAELLFSVIPELRGLIGDQPAVAAIPPVESAARFGVTLRRLLAACAAEAELLIVVLDDMQWCDPASTSSSRPRARRASTSSSCRSARWRARSSRGSSPTRWAAPPSAPRRSPRSSATRPTATRCSRAPCSRRCTTRACSRSRRATSAGTGTMPRSAPPSCRATSRS
ncbi:MAG: hypothetical protein E6J90_36920 [Deltaproteobacteria bacterium]|nr:MAG: hypothetical protein E6J90_36920 [Deltaproteobacteria bacterium]